MSISNKYIMDDSRESDRLSTKVDSQYWVEKYLDLYLKNAGTFIDIGCGPGVIIKTIAEKYPNINVTGMDFSKERINDALSNVSQIINAEVAFGDANDIPFESNTFDIVFCRFLLEYLPDPMQAISEMIRICKTGGTVILQDLDGQIVWRYPEDNKLQEVIQKALKYVKKTGFDPFVGRKLYNFLYKGGMRNINAQLDPYNFYPGRIDEKNLMLWDLKLDIILNAVKSVFNNNFDEMYSLKEQFLNYLKREDTLSYSILFTVSGIKK